jgi:hypothetical protein
MHVDSPFITALGSQRGLFRVLRFPLWEGGRETKTSQNFKQPFKEHEVDEEGENGRSFQLSAS